MAQVQGLLPVFVSFLFFYFFITNIIIIIGVYNKWPPYAHDSVGQMERTHKMCQLCIFHPWANEKRCQ